VATQRFYESLQTPSPTRIPEGITTAIHKWDISDSQNTVYKGSGAVPGFLLSQWALSERGGVLRVASTSTPVWLGETSVPSQSFVTTLEERSGVLAQLGQVAGLGKGERIYAVRFIDDVGYVVTFRQVDPLYTVDVSDPARPRVAGELKILGYSAYLHPVDKGLLLGVGQDATEEGRRRGAQLSLFDVSDARNPVRLHQRAIGPDSSSEAEYDHHAFLYWPATKLAVLPVQIYEFKPDGTGSGFVGAIGFGIDKAAGITETGRIQHASDPGGNAIRRSVVVGDRLFTVSDLGVKASTLDKLTEVAWVAY
jgi:uncharacterized secreted protein with C-terminal beta-propeller domain